MTLSKAVILRALLDVSDDTQITQPTNITGYEIIGVITPAALDGTANDIDTIRVDPGNGTFYAPLAAAGAAIDIQMDNIDVDEYLTLAPITVMRQKLVGARARMHLSEEEDADREFFFVCVSVPGDTA